MEASKTERPCKAKYTIDWFNSAWEKVAGNGTLHTAHQMWECVDRWNRENQRIARDPGVVITDPLHPVHISIEVHYVEA